MTAPEPVDLGRVCYPRAGDPEPITLADLEQIRAGMWANRPACARHYPTPCECEAQ